MLLKLKLINKSIKKIDNLIYNELRNNKINIDEA